MLRISRVRAYLSAGLIETKSRMAYNAWFWANFFVQTILLVVMVYFWNSVYESRQEIAGQTLQQTINYIIIARILSGLTDAGLIQRFGQLIKQGGLAIELLRPIDFQLVCLSQVMTRWCTDLLMRWQLWVVGVVFLQLQLPADWMVYLLFAVCLLLGMAIMFFFEWILACLVFFTTESWGLKVLKDGLAAFLSGALIPLTLMPSWLKTFADWTPFSKVVFTPAALLSGLIPVDQGPAVVLQLSLWLVGLVAVSRFVFRFAVKHADIQGG